MADKKTTQTKATTKVAPKAVKKTAKQVTEVKTIEQLREDLITLTKDQFDAKLSHAQGELVNPRSLTVRRKEIARTKTAIRAAEIVAAKENK